MIRAFSIQINATLASNGPHIQQLQAHNMRFILGAKESDHGHLFEQAFEEEKTKRSTNIYMDDPHDPKIRHHFFFVNGVSLNKTHHKIKVNFLEYWQMPRDEDGNEIPEEEQTPRDKKRARYWSWVTDLEITEENVSEIMRAGRARWRIENETFNTLKNQAQFWSGEEEPQHGFCNVDDVGIHGRSGSAMMLRSLPSGFGKEPPKGQIFREHPQHFH